MGTKCDVRLKQIFPPECQYISTRLYGVTSQTITFFVFVSNFYFLTYEGSKQISLWIYKHKMDKTELNPPPSLWSSHASTEFHFAGRETSSVSPRSVSHKALWRAPWRYILSWHYCNPDHRFKSNKDVCTADTCRTLAFCRSTTVEPWTLATLSSPQWTSQKGLRKYITSCCVGVLSWQLGTEISQNGTQNNTGWNIFFCKKIRKSCDNKKKSM